MNIKDCIDLVDNEKPNQYTIKEKVMWLSFIEAIIINEVLKTHEGYDGRYDMFEGYSEDKLTVKLIVPAPYDRLYTQYLKMKIDEANGEITRYNNSAALYNTYMSEYKKYYNKTHMPLDVTKKTKDIVIKVPMGNGLSDAEMENVIRELTFIITEQVSGATSPDILEDIVNEYVQNNIEMLKGKDGRDGVNGKDGYTPQKNIDYFDGEKGDKGDKGERGDQGARGQQGEPGINGYTPKKGTDYYTEAEKQELIDEIKDDVFVVNDDWNQNDETAPDYIKNRTHYETFGKNYGYTEFDLESTSMDVSDGIQTVSLTDPLEPGVAYLYKTDKGSGTFTVDFNYQYADGQVILGDTGYTGDYFKVDGGSYINFGIGYDKEGYIQIYQISVKTLDEKYIPDTIARVADVEAMIGIVNDELESILAGGVD